MKKPVEKVLSLTLCALLALSGIGGVACAVNNPTGTGPVPVDAAPADSGAKAVPTSSYDPDAEKNVKDETVYVLATADGSVHKIIVSDWVKNTLGQDFIGDVTGLTGIENVKGKETFTLGGDNSCVWNAEGNDIYYQGDFDYTNNQYELMDINGKQEKIYVPFAMLTGVLLDNGVFSNVSVTNGKIVNDGDRTVVVGLAFPGLQDSLGLDRDTLELPDYVEITADVTDFMLETTVTVAANELFNDVAGEAEGHDGLEELSGLDGKLDELTGAMAQLIDGSSRLYDGLCTLLTSSEELVAGIDQLAAGGAQLKRGAGELDAGAAQLQAGAAALSQGLNALTENNATLNAGAKQVFDTLLATATAQLAAAGVQAPPLTVENYAQVLDGVIVAAGESTAGQQVAALKASLDDYNAFYLGLNAYTAGVGQAAKGAGELDQGIGTLKIGTASLNTGAAQLYDGILTLKNGAPALVSGVTQLRDGAMELSNGLKEFNEQGVQKLVDAFDGDLAGLMDRVDALREVSERYNSFSGISGEMDGQVKFIWRTQAVETQD